MGQILDVNKNICRLSLFSILFIAGHAATRGCHRCKKQFPGDIGKKIYSGFDRENWEKRTTEGHLEEIRQINACRSKGEREDLESLFVTRYSVLVDLPYYSSVRMAIIDPMHNLFLGTSKFMLNLWKEVGILDDDAFKRVKNNLEGIEAPSDIGKLPTKLVSAFGSFTADELKNWTVLFSIYALKDILSAEHLECWRSFVLACRILCSKTLNDNSIQLADMLIMRFCKRFENLYGVERVTPNIHLHGHLIEWLFDYGPIYSFWLFSFERYNGFLGNLPTNKRLIEVQIFRRFLRDNFCYEIILPTDFNESLGNIVQDVLSTADRGSLKEISAMSLYPLQRLASRHLQNANENWSDLSYMTYKSLIKPSVLNDLEMSHIADMYKVLYPDACNIIPSVSYRKCRYIYMGMELYGSMYSRTRRSSTVLAFWHSNDGRINSFATPYANPKPGLIHYFLVHNIDIDGECKEHLLAKFDWMKPLINNNRYNYFGKPIEVWHSDLFEFAGPASFIPVQRIKSKFIKIEKVLWGKNVAIVVPRDRAVNI